MDDGKYGVLTPVYIGVNRPDILYYTVGNLTTGLPYRFTLQAININGYSVPSPIVTIYSCDRPFNLSSPSYFSSDYLARTITLTWNLPRDDGGCSISGF
jgi:hypothetical protein